MQRERGGIEDQGEMFGRGGRCLVHRGVQFYGLVVMSHCRVKFLHEILVQDAGYLSP